MISSSEDTDSLGQHKLKINPISLFTIETFSWIFANCSVKHCVHLLLSIVATSSSAHGTQVAADEPQQAVIILCKHLKKPVCTVGQKWIFDSLRAPNSKRTFGCLTSRADNTAMKIWTVSPAAPIVCWGLPSRWRKQQSPLELVTRFRGGNLFRSSHLNDFPKNPFRFPERRKGGRTKKPPLIEVI